MRNHVSQQQQFGKLVTLSLLAVIIVELTVGGVLWGRRLLRRPPVLPILQAGDPLFARQLPVLARDAEQRGTTEDWLNLSVALLAQGFYDEAELAFRRVIELDPLNQEGRFGLAFCLDRVGRIEESKPEYHRAIALNSRPNVTDRLSQYAWMALGRNELREEHAAEAEEIFRRTDRFQTQAVQLIKLLIRSGRAAEAMPRLDAALKQFPMSLEFHFLRYRALLELDRPEEAAKVADLFDRLRPTISLNFNTDYVRHYRKRTGFDEAIEEYNQLISDRNMDRMAAVLEELLKEIGTLPVPMASTVQVSLAEVELQRQRSERILELVHTLHLTEVEGADVLQLEGAALQMQGHHAQAVALWERAMQMGPNPQLAEKLAEEADRIKDTRKRDHWRAQAALLQTRELFWNNRIEEALPPVRQALQLDGENPQAWYYLGQVQRVRGDFPAAREAYEKCLQLAPWYGRADAALRLLPAT